MSVEGYDAGSPANRWTSDVLVLVEAAQRISFLEVCAILLLAPAFFFSWILIFMQLILRFGVGGWLLCGWWQIFRKFQCKDRSFGGIWRIVVHWSIQDLLEVGYLFHLYGANFYLKINCWEPVYHRRTVTKQLKSTNFKGSVSEEFSPMKQSCIILFIRTTISVENWQSKEENLYLIISS